MNGDDDRAREWLSPRAGSNFGAVCRMTPHASSAHEAPDSSVRSRTTDSHGDSGSNGVCFLHKGPELFQTGVCSVSRSHMVLRGHRLLTPLLPFSHFPASPGCFTRTALDLDCVLLERQDPTAFDSVSHVHLQLLIHAELCRVTVTVLFHNFLLAHLCIPFGFFLWVCRNQLGIPLSRVDAYSAKRRLQAVPNIGPRRRMQTFFYSDHPSISSNAEAKQGQSKGTRETFPGQWAGFRTWTVPCD